MSAKAKVKRKKKAGPKKSAPFAPKFKGSWTNSGIKLGKFSERLIKLFNSKKELESKVDSPLVWFVDETEFADQLDAIRRWHGAVIKPSKVSATADEVFESVERITKQLESGDSSSNGSGSDVLKSNSVQELTLGTALTLLGAGHSIRAIVGHCDFEDWNGQVARLFELSRAVESNAKQSAEVYQLLAVELPMAIAVLVPEIEDHLQIAQRCCQKMTVSLNDMLDHDGWLHSKYAQHLGVLSASWIRCGLMAGKLDLNLDDEATSKLEWVVRQAIRCLRPDGTVLFSRIQPNANLESGSKKPALMNPSFAYSMTKLSADSDDKKVIQQFMGFGSDGYFKKLPKPSNISEWAQSLVLRSNWSHESPMVALDFSSPSGVAETSLPMEISRSRTLVQGPTMPVVKINGLVERLSDPFEVVCEECDKDVEYVELEAETKNGVEIQRQILLSRVDEFLLIADVVKPPMAAKIEYNCQYPLANGILGMRETENREVYLRTNEIQSLVLPLALPEWKGGGEDRLEFEDVDGQTTGSASALTLRQTRDGFGLYAPLFFDLNPQRSRKKRTWRQLTVAEERQKVPADIACAYRIQIDEQQWCFYRAVSGLGNRTFLGENFSGEFVFNRFGKDGKVKPLIVI